MFKPLLRSPFGSSTTFLHLIKRAQKAVSTPKKEKLDLCFVQSHCSGSNSGFMEKRGESTLFMKCRKRVEGQNFNAKRRHLVPSREAHNVAGGQKYRWSMRSMKILGNIDEMTLWVK